MSKTAREENPRLITGATDSASEEFGSEYQRRTTDHLLAYWNWLRGSREFPSYQDIDQSVIPGIWRYVFVVEVADHILDTKVLYAGSALKAVCQCFVHDEQILAHLTPQLRQKLLVAISVAAKMKEPTFDSGELVREDCGEVLYRFVVLPLSDDQIRVNRLIGAFNFKLTSAA